MEHSRRLFTQETIRTRKAAGSRKPLAPAKPEQTRKARRFWRHRTFPVWEHTFGAGAWVGRPEGSLSDPADESSSTDSPSTATNKSEHPRSPTSSAVNPVGGLSMPCLEASGIDFVSTIALTSARRKHPPRS